MPSFYCVEALGFHLIAVESNRVLDGRGQTYYYVTTAVSTAGVESAYSSQVMAVVPSP